MVTNDKIGPTVPSTCACPQHASRISYRASMTRSCVDRVQFFNLGRGRGRCPGGCQEPRPGCANFARRVGLQLSVRIPV